MPSIPLKNQLKHAYIAPVLALYGVLFLALAGIAEYMQLVNPPSSSYSLQTARPITIILAPVANNWQDYFGSLAHMGAYLVLFAFVVAFDSDLESRAKFRTAFCLIPVAGGFLGSGLYYVQLWRLGATLGGAGSSIISAAMTGELLVVSIVAVFDSVRRKEILSLVISALFTFALVFVFSRRLSLRGKRNRSFVWVPFRCISLVCVFPSSRSNHSILRTRRRTELDARQKERC